MNKKLITRLLGLFLGLFPLFLQAQNNCETLSIETIDNELIVSGLAIGNTKARIYNNNYELVYTCEFDCEPTVTIPNATAGETYHFTFEFFTDNFAYITQDNQDYTIGSSPLDIELCKETLKFYTQAEVDDFCGCEIALNGMEIGNRFDPQLSDVFDISNLSSIKAVGNTLIV